MTGDQLLRLVVTPIGIAALWWSFRRIGRDVRGLGGLPGLGRRLGYALGRLVRRMAR